MLTRRLALADDAAAHYRLGLLLASSDIEKAGKEFTTASALDPEFDSAAQTLHTALNIAALEPNPARRLVVIGRGLGLVEEWGLASRAFEQGGIYVPLEQHIRGLVDYILEKMEH